MRKFLLASVGVAVLALLGSGVAGAEAEELPDFCSGEMSDGRGVITCETPTEEMRWTGYGRCKAPYRGGVAVWWNYSEQVTGSQTVVITCERGGPPGGKVELLAWEEGQ